MTLPYDLNILDVVLLSILVVFTLRGTVRGFLAEVTGIFGVLLGIWLAGRYYHAGGAWLAQHTNSEWVYVVAYIALLCLAMLAVSLISRCLYSFLKLAYATWINHFAGAVIGGIKGAALAGCIVYGLTYFLSDADFLQTSRVTPHMRELIAWFQGVLPHSGQFALH